ncbi:MAG: Eukaryotic cytochrome b561 [Syntrophaceae bacterium PtaB.Bin038]|nr:MAG: Eukaryotic cytochrome b561 [Syntrophaceae bacterium PtaB.Bin038]
MLLGLHAGFMIAGLVLMTAGVTTARLMRKRPWWLRVHRALGACGALSVLFGVSAAVAMVAGFGGPHFQVLHAWVGAVAAFFAVATPALGQLQFVTRQRRAEVRKLHRWAGAMTLILLFLNILSGLVLVEVIPNVRSF